MECLDFHHNLFVAVEALDLPAFEVEVDDFVSGKLFLIVQVRQEDRNRSILTDQSYDPESNGFELFSVFGRYLAQVFAGWRNSDHSFLFAALHKGKYSAKGGLCRTAKQKIPAILCDKPADQLIARIASIKSDDRLGRDKRQQLFYLLALAGIDRDHGPCYGQTPEDIVDSGDKALRIVPFSRVLESAVRVKLLSDLLSGRERVLGAVDGKDRHPMPDEFGTLRPTFIRQTNRPTKYVLKRLPSDLRARSSKRAAADCFRVRPQSTSAGLSEELTGLHIDPLAGSTGGNGEYEGDEPWKRELPGPSEIL